MKTMGKLYVVEGPREIANQFGYSGTLVPEGRFAVVWDGELTDGGYGPVSFDGRYWRTRQRAEQEMAKAGGVTSE